MKNDKYTVLVNSSDGFEDCWYPFFKLFSTYWKHCDARILLNTEVKQWVYKDLEIECTKSQGEMIGRRLTWSECLINALNMVKTPLVLYLQEDYFIEGFVQHEIIEEIAEQMISDQNIKCVGLTNFGSCGPFRPTKDEKLWEVSQKAKYRISTQASIWRLDTLKSYLREPENGWMFEIFGTKRAWKRSECFLTVNREKFGPKLQPIISYLHTGIIKGKWHPEIPDLFRKHGLEINFEDRGFYVKKRSVLDKVHVIKKLCENPGLLVKGLLGF